MKKTDRYQSLCNYYWQEASQKYAFDVAVDWRLIGNIIDVESDFDPNAVSPAGARGLMQLMPMTWGAGFYEEAFNPERNIAKGIDYLGLLWSMFKAERGRERWRYALGAYNAGPGWIIKAQTICKARGLPADHWDEIVKVLPALTGDGNAKQTIDYVETIMAEYERGLIGAAIG